MLRWLGLILSALDLLNRLTKTLEKRGIIGQAEAELVQRVLAQDEELIRDVRKARAAVRADARTGGLRDDDGHRRG